MILRVYGSTAPWLILLLLLGGCSRTHYRIRADRETYRTLHQKTAGQLWALPPGFRIQPQPGSRLYDPTPIDDPLLPVPAPRLYAYQMPDVPERDPKRFRPSDMTDKQPVVPPSPAARPDSPNDSPPQGSSPPTYSTSTSTPIQPVSHAVLDDPNSAQELLPDPDSPMDEPLTLTSVKPIPAEVWRSIPPGCLRRMIEFESLQREYERTFLRAPGEQLLDDSERLALEDILMVALQNSREYQRRKEILYSVALQLTLQRFDYDLKFAPFGNGTDVNFRHNRSGGNTINDLSIPTRLGADKMLATGGNLIARFANDILLTFRGPQGFTSNVSSELLFDLSQSVLQRDIQLESLTQSERNVIYAARDFARFRKTFFRDLASRYYGLILTYRQIEIDTQDYFTNLRAFLQGEAEFRVGRRSRIQVDQFEQTALSSRSRLIRSCNSLESGLDNLKVTIGLPTETPLNLNLTELDELTLRDEATVGAQLVRRSRRSLLQDRTVPSPQRETLVNGAINLIRRMIELAKLRGRLGQDSDATEALQVLLARVLVDEAGIIVRFNRTTLENDRQSMPPATPLRIFERTMDLVDSILEMTERDLDLAALTQQDEPTRARLEMSLADQRDRLEALRESLRKAVDERELTRLPELIRGSEALLVDVDQLSLAAEQLVGRAGLTAEQFAEITTRQVDYLLAESNRSLSQQSLELAQIDIDVDEAMLTALVRRFDLLNERGSVADVWRQIKLAGDDLRTILNLNATQVIRTRLGQNKPFAFTFDDSQTQLGMSIDTPLNRKAQRNAFRISLINYQAALRNLVQLEDTIKLAIRDDLRNLQLDREQYQIAVASAALASERVNSTRLQLQQNIAGATARDFVEAQQAYTQALSSVASQHIGYILDRIDLFLDLEALEVDGQGMWPDLYDEQLQPTPHFNFPGCGHIYGHLPRRTWHSAKIKRMLLVPPGSAEIQKSDQAADAAEDVPPPPPGSPPPVLAPDPEPDDPT